MKLARTAVRLSALAAAVILVLPIVIAQVSAFGSAGRSGFDPRPEPPATQDAPTDEWTVGAPPVLVDDPSPEIQVTHQDPQRPRPRKVADAPAPEPETTRSPSTASEPSVTSSPPAPSPEVVFKAGVKRTKARTGHWKAKELAAPSTGVHGFSLEWSGDGNLMFSLRDLKSGELVASDTSSRTSKSMEAVLAEGRADRLAVWAKAGRGRFVVTMRAPAGAPPPSAPPDPSDPPPPSSVTGVGYPGQPGGGTLLWGASIQGNGDPVSRHEVAAGHKLTLRRTFWRWDQRTGSMITTVRNDVASGRLPWVSVKTPSWASMARGDHDAAIDEMLRSLDAMGGPVWLTLHHEPEGGGGSNSPDDPGGPSAHVEMNRQVRARMTALGTDNISLAPVLMSWTFNPRSGRNPNDWWAPGIYDFLGVDHYQDNQASLLNDTWFTIRSWAAGKSVDVAVGEWGMRGTDEAAGRRVHEWYDQAAGSHSDGRGARVVALSAFDSGLNSPTGSWELKGAQLEAFRTLLNDRRTTDPR
jgi:hypothetical protein